MLKKDLIELSNLSRMINSLPKGYISRKNVKGNIYFYHQWTEHGQKYSRYLRPEEIKDLSFQIEKRKQLQQQVKVLKSASENQDKVAGNSFFCTLMHKNTSVADLLLNNTSGSIIKILTVFNSEHFPIGVLTKDQNADLKAFNNWWEMRSIPASRMGLENALDTLEIEDVKLLLLRCCGLSLSDQYWICPKGSGLKWNEINFFTNDFSEDIGNILFGSSKHGPDIDFSSPDNTSDGTLKKCWKIINGKRCLIKGGTNPYQQQPLNEVIATEIMKRLGIDCVPYSLIWENNYPYSVCEDFIDENTELVTAWRISNIQKQQNSVSLYDHFISCANKLGIPNVVPFLDRMIVLDYIIENEDRHLNNFGAVRDAQTLQWLGMAPVYDSGSSLGFDKNSVMMAKNEAILCRPFKKSHEEQLKLVTSFDWIDFDALSDIKELITDILSNEQARDFMEPNRIQAIANLAKDRVLTLQKISSRE